jgi:hypothetical protein
MKTERLAANQLIARHRGTPISFNMLNDPDVAQEVPTGFPVI